MDISGVASNETLVCTIVVFGTLFISEKIFFDVVDEHILGDVLNARDVATVVFTLHRVVSLSGGMGDNSFLSGPSLMISPCLVVVTLNPEGEIPFSIHHQIVHIFVVVEGLHVGNKTQNIRATTSNTKIYHIADADDNSRDCS